MSHFSWGAFVDGLAVTAVAVLVLMLVTWLIGQAIGRFNVVDVAWGLGFVVIAWVAYGASAGEGNDTRRLLVAVAGVDLGSAARGVHRDSQPGQG